MNNILYPLAGGLLIGLASTVLMLFAGKIAGISGILAKILDPLSINKSMSIFFVLGLLLGGTFMKVFFSSFFSYGLDSSYVRLAIAGIIVGFGTQLGSGCTSGHGVCGLARLSVRSLVATLTFISFGILTVYCLKVLL